MYLEGAETPESVLESVAVENYRLSTDAGLIPA
jgi:hypothetical protein